VDIASLVKCLTACGDARHCEAVRVGMNRLIRSGVRGIAGLMEVGDPEAVRANLPEGVMLLSEEDAFAHLEKLLGAGEVRALRRVLGERQEVHEAIRAVRKEQAARYVCSRCTGLIEKMPDDGMLICEACRAELRDEAQSQKRDRFEGAYSDPDNLSDEAPAPEVAGVDLAAEGTESESVEQIVEKTDEAPDGPPPPPEPSEEDAPVPPADRKVD